MAGTASIAWINCTDCADSDAQTFITTYSITDATQKSAICTLVQDLKSNNLWSLGEGICPIVGGSASSHAGNLKNPGTFDLTFNGGWTHASTGMTPNGTTGYADTGYNCNTQHSDGLMSIGIYSRTNQASGTISDMGASNAAFTQQTSLWLRFGDTFYGLAACNGIISHVGNTDSTGWYFASRTGASANFLQKNSTQNSFSEGTGTPSLNIYIGCYNLDGVATSFSNKEFAFVWLGASLSTSEASTLYTIIQDFQTTLSRNV